MYTCVKKCEGKQLFLTFSTLLREKEKERVVSGYGAFSLKMQIRVIRQ